MWKYLFWSGSGLDGTQMALPLAGHCPRPAPSNLLPFCFLMSVACCASSNAAGAAPGARPQECSVSKITCSISTRQEDFGGNKIPVQPGEYHYRIWLPKDYYRDDARRYPALFIASPDGNAGMGNCEEIAKERKWIVVMLVESCNSCSLETGVGNFLAAHDDAVRRFRIQEGMKFATGLSGGARRQSLNVGLRPGFAGLILQAAGFVMLPDQSYLVKPFQQYPNLCVYGVFGTGDPNCVEIGLLEAQLPKSTLRRFTCFNGGHEYAPPERMEEAVDWLAFNALLNLDLSGDGAKHLGDALDDAMTAAALKGKSRLKGVFALSDISKVFAAHNLEEQDSFKAQADKLKTALGKLAAEANVSNELAAKAEYEMIATEESDALAKAQMIALQEAGNAIAVPAKRKKAAAPANSKDNNAASDQPLAAILERYKACAKKYPGTIFGLKAAARSKVATHKIQPPIVKAVGEKIEPRL